MSPHDIDKLKDLPVYLISLRSRPDRLRATHEVLDRIGWTKLFRWPTTLTAWHGWGLPLPESLAGGGMAGAWGCKRSHEDCLADSLESGADGCIVLEDDVVSNRGDWAGEMRRFLLDTPDDWDQLMPGAQAWGGPREHVNERVDRLNGSNRTHCYLVRDRPGISFRKELLRHWYGSVGHCDHLMGAIQSGFRVYSPKRQLVGQRSGFSDVAGSHLDERYWVEGGEPTVVLPYWGEFGWCVTRHVRWVEQLEATHKVVCCRPGEECLYPSASEFVLDYPDGPPDAQRCEDGSGPDEEVWKLVRKRYPDHEILRPSYPNPWAWDHAADKVPIVAKEHLSAVDVALCPRRRNHGREKNWNHWPEVAQALRSAGYTVGLVGRPDTSVDTTSDVQAWHHPDGPTAGTVDLLRRSKVYIGGDTGVSHLAALLDVPMVLFAPPAHLHGWSALDIIRRATKAPLNVLGPSAWEDASEVISATLRALRGQPEPVRASAWADGQGERMWEELHGKLDPSAEWLDEFSSRIPCGPCKSHWNELRGAHPPTFEPIGAWRQWTWASHQKVNARLYRPGLTFVQAGKRWGWR